MKGVLKIAVQYSDTHEFNREQLQDLLRMMLRRIFLRIADLKRRQTQVRCLLLRCGRDEENEHLQSSTIG